MKIGIIGCGAVGETIYKVMQMYHEDVRGYDIASERSHDSLSEVLQCEAVFLCVPTKQGKSGRLDVSAVTSNLNILVEKRYHKLLILKSTLPVGFFDTIPTFDLDIVFAPEFLHAWRAAQDFIDPPFVVASGKSALKLMEVLHWIPKDRFHVVSYDTAILLKLIMNCFASTKISFVNEVEWICDACKVNPLTIMNFLRMEGRCAEPYSTPRRGAFGGSCLPKDLLELVNSNDTFLLKAVHEVNEKAKKREMK